MLKNGLIYYFVLLIPFIVFYDLFKKHWQDRNLKRGFFVGIFFGIITVLFVRGAFSFINFLSGFELRNFIAESHRWWIVLFANICVVGFLEELFKSFGSSAAGLLCENDSGVAVVFMNYAGCALGFSFMENLQYFNAFGPEIILSRVFVGSIAHMFFSCITSKTVILAKIRSNKFLNVAKSGDNAEMSLYKSKTASLFAAIGTMFGVMLSAIMHGSFNFFIFYFNIQSFNGFLLVVLSFFVLSIYNCWKTSLRLDMPDYMFISSCPKCGSVSFLPFKFCGTCGSRVNILRKFTFVVKEVQQPFSLPSEESNEDKTNENDCK